VTNGPFTCSDHSYVLLNTTPVYPSRKGTTFEYQHSWAYYQDTHNLVKKKWKSHFIGTPTYRLTQKLKKFKLDLKSWSKRKFGNFKQKLERNAETLLRVDQR